MNIYKVIKNSIVTSSALLSFASMAATNTLTAPKTLGDAFKKERFGLFLYSSSSPEGTSTEFNGVSQTDIAYLTYKISNNDSLRLENRLSLSKSEGNDLTASFSRSVLRYTRRGLLNQDQHGLNLSASIEKRFLPEREARVGSNTNGLNRIILNTSHQLTDTVGLGLSTYFALSDMRESATDTTSRNYILVIASQSIDLGNSYGLSFTQEIFKNNNKSDAGEIHDITVTMELSKQITDKFGTAISVGGSPISGKDEWTYSSDFYKNLNYSLALTYSAF